MDVDIDHPSHHLEDNGMVDPNAWLYVRTDDQLKKEYQILKKYDNAEAIRRMHLIQRELARRSRRNAPKRVVE